MSATSPGGVSLLEEQQQHARLPRREATETLLDATALDQVPGRHRGIPDLEGQASRGLLLAPLGPAHGVGYVAAGAEHEAFDPLEVFHPTGPQGLDHHHHDLLCQILGRRYVEPQVPEPHRVWPG